LDPETALRVHTAGSLSLSGGLEAGALVPETSADLVLVDRDPVSAGVAEVLDTEVLGTWIAGSRVWPGEERETT
jgi:predicted amidohydrolase YtcJ